MPTSVATVTANGVAKTYTISYNANGGTGAPGNQIKTHNKDLILSNTKPSRTGYAFKEWNTKSNGSGTSYSSGGAYKANAAVTLYAQWTIIDNNPPVLNCVVPTSIRTGSVRYTKSMFSCTDSESGVGKIQYLVSDSPIEIADFTDLNTTKSAIRIICVDNAGNKTGKTCYTGVDNVPPMSPEFFRSNQESSNIISVTCNDWPTNPDYEKECTITVKKNMSFNYTWNYGWDRTNDRACDDQNISISCAGYDSTTEKIYRMDGTLLRTHTVYHEYFPYYYYYNNHYRILTSKDKLGNVSKALRLNIVYQ